MTRAFVLGNGPSLKKHDLSKLKDEILFGCNLIWLLDELERKVNYYFYIDSWDLAIFKEEIFKYISSEQVNKAYILPYYKEYFEDCTKCNFSPPSFPFVGGSMIKEAIALDFEPIYVIGMDLEYRFDEIKNKKEIVDLDNLPFSDEAVKCLKDLHKKKHVHFENRFLLSDAVDNSHFSSEYQTHRSFYYYTGDEAIRTMEKKFNGNSYKNKIFNAGVGGKLETFERVDYDSLFQDE